MTKEEKRTLVELYDRVYFGENIDVDRIEGLESIYQEVKRMIDYRPNKKRFINSLTDTEIQIFKEIENAK